MSTIINPLQRKSYERALQQECPINALVNRVLVIQIREEDEKMEHVSVAGVFNGNTVNVGGIILPAESKEKMTAKNEVVVAVVKSVGPTSDGHVPAVKVNDVVFVFPNVFETKISIDDIDYFSYGERDCVAGKPSAEITLPEIEENK